jgi:hypothetical protein
MSENVDAKLWCTAGQRFSPPVTWEKTQLAA